MENTNTPNKSIVLVTGSAGQLGQALQAKSLQHTNLQFYFAPSAEADLTNKESLTEVFVRVKPDFCINAAAYTAVDKAESEPEKAFAINVTGAKNLAEVCHDNGCKLIQISTDFVFDGSKDTPYTEQDETNPQGVYAETKRDGELEVIKALKEHFIVRTAWVYSEFGNNFMKTMLRLGADRDSLSVVSDQTGTPTNANDLADAAISIVEFSIANPGAETYGIYHFSNEGVATWYEFAKEIFAKNNVTINLQPIPTAAYPTPAKRPAYSVLDKSKIKETFNIQIRQWQDAL